MPSEKQGRDEKQPLIISNQGEEPQSDQIALDDRARQGLLNYQRLKTLLPWLGEYEDGYL